MSHRLDISWFVNSFFYFILAYLLYFQINIIYRKLNYMMIEYVWYRDLLSKSITLSIYPVVKLIFH